MRSQRLTQLEKWIQFILKPAQSRQLLTRRWKRAFLAIANCLTLAAVPVQTEQGIATAHEPAKHEKVAALASDDEPSSNRDPQNSAKLTANDTAADPLPAGARVRLGSTRWRHKTDVALARFSPDGKILATSGSMETIRLWEVTTGKQLHELTETGRWEICGVVFSPDGTKLTSIQQGGVIQLWDVATGKQVCPAAKHPGEGERYGMARSPDGKVVATVGAKEVRLWDAATLKPLKSFPTGGTMGFAAPGIAFSPDGNLLAASGKLDIKLWNLKTGEVQLKIPGAHTQGVTSLVFAPDSRSLISGGNKDIVMVRLGNRAGGSSAQIAIWDVATGERLADLTTQSFDSGLYSLALSADGKILVSGHHSEARVWDVETRTLARIIDEEYSVRGGYPCTPDLAPDGKWLAARTDGHSVGLWNVETGDLSENSETHRRSIASIASASQGKLLVTSANEDTIRLWDPATGRPSGEVQINSRGTGFSAIAITPDNQSFAVGGGYRLMSGGGGKLEFKGNLSLGNLASAAVLPEAHFSDVIGALAYSPDGKTLAAATNNLSEQTDEAILIIDPDDGAEINRLNGHAGAICLIAFSPDGKTLYSVGSDKKLRTWDITAAKVTRTVEINGHAGPSVNRAAISRDSKRVATCEMFGKVVVITDVASGEQVREIVIPDTLGNLLAISADGRILASACQPISNTDTRFDERIHLWDIATGQELFSFDASTDGTVATLCLLPDGKTLVAGMDRGTALVWDISNIQTKR
jgi:WD40 repeat protein